MAQMQLLGRMLLSFVIGATLLLTLVVDWTPLGDRPLRLIAVLE